MALPVTAMYGLAVSIACGLLDGRIWAQFGMLAVSSYCMVILNNAHALIRVYSRMVSCSYITLFIMAGLLSLPVKVSVVMQCVVMFYLLLFRACRDKKAMGLVFYAFLMLGIASTMFVQVLFFVPLAWVLLHTNILAGNVRTFFASILGLVAPYWFVGGYYIYIGEVGLLLAHFGRLRMFGDLFCMSGLPPHKLVTYAVLVFLSLIGMVHFYRNSYKDKIRTRMLFEIFMAMDVGVAVFLALQPQHYDFLVGMMVVNTSPLIAHFLSLTKTWITNVSFCLIVMMVLLLTVYNLWMPSLTF